MDDTDPIVAQHRTGLPFRPRTLFAGYSAFTAADHGVLISPTARGKMLYAARQADPRQTGGVVVGRALRDAEGSYTLVTDVVSAPADFRGQGHVRLPAELTTALQDTAATQFPSCDPLGWWRSHLTPGSHSSAGRENQPTWSAYDQVGILVFARSGGEWARVYVGPDAPAARPVAADRTTADQPVTGRAAADQPVTGRAAADQPAPAGPGTAATGHLPTSAQVLRPFLTGREPATGAGASTGATGILRRLCQPGLDLLRPAARGRLLVFLSIVLIAIAGSAAGVYHSLASLIEDRIPAGTAADLSWSCRSSTGGASYECATGSGFPADLEWQVNGRAVGRGSSVGFTVPPGSGTVVVEVCTWDDRRLVRLGRMPLTGPLAGGTHRAGPGGIHRTDPLGGPPSRAPSGDAAPAARIDD